MALKLKYAQFYRVAKTLLWNLLEASKLRIQYWWNQSKASLAYRKDKLKKKIQIEIKLKVFLRRRICSDLRKNTTIGLYCVHWVWYCVIHEFSPSSLTPSHARTHTHISVLLYFMLENQKRWMYDVQCPLLRSDDYERIERIQGCKF